MAGRLHLRTIFEGQRTTTGYGLTGPAAIIDGRIKKEAEFERYAGGIIDPTALPEQNICLQKNKDAAANFFYMM